MRNPRTLAIVVGAFVLVLGGFLFLRSPRPIIELKAETVFSLGPFDVTNTYITSWLVIAFIIGFSFLATRGLQIIPRGLQNLVEAVLEAIWNLVVNTAGEKHARRMFPVIATILIYVALSNWFGLLPFFATVGTVETLEAHEGEEVHEHAIVFNEIGGFNVVMPNAGDVEVEVVIPEGATPQQEQAAKVAAVEEATHDLAGDEKAGVLIPFLRSVNTDLNAPLALAIWSAIFVEFWGISTHGFFSYAGRFANFRRLLRGRIVDGIIDAAVGGLEFIAELARLISFTFRLFGNIFAGEVLFLVVAFLAPLGALVVVYGLELFVGVIQAFIFAMLTLVFGVIAVSAASHGDDHGGGEQHG